MRTLCADLGGTRLKLAAVENGVVLENEVSPIDTNAGMESVLSNLGVRCKEMMSRHPGEWKGLGVAFPGLLDENTCHVIYCSGKYAGADRIDLPKWADETLGLEMKLINDARAAIIGEINYGSATGETDAVMLILGTGIGTAAVCQGKVYRGKHGMAGLLGWTFLHKAKGGCPRLGLLNGLATDIT
ncbi:MAG: ROK family protein [Kiritimatiellae bacterium]|nr:ROK family protein [Kiritimatiellia bacterium]